ncbi:MAG: energy transducer TonB [Chitinophagales bacterium]
MGLQAGKESDRFWIAATLSLVAHGALFLLLAAAPPGMPAGVEGARVYSLTYLGSLPSGEAGSASPATAVVAAKPAAKQPPPPPVKPVYKPAPAPAPKPAPKPAFTAKLAAAPKLTGNVLASAKGTDEVPLPAKPAAERPQQAGPAPMPAEKPPASDHAPSPAASAAPAAPDAPAGAPGGGEAGGAGNPAPPPRGVMMVARLPKLIYPKGAQNSGVKGTVVLRALVGVEGGKTKVEVERSSGDKALDEYARRGVERGLLANAWTRPYVMRLEARFERGVPDVRVLDEPVEVGG